MSVELGTGGIAAGGVARQVVITTVCGDCGGGRCCSTGLPTGGRIGVVGTGSGAADDNVRIGSDRGCHGAVGERLALKLAQGSGLVLDLFALVWSAFTPDPDEWVVTTSETNNDADAA